MEQARNKDQKCPVVLLLDTSGSMAGMPIDELNKALIQIKEDILSDTMLSNRLELGIVAFDDDARIERPIDLISPDTDLPILNVDGRTNLVAGMNKAIELVTDRKNFYKSNGEQYYRPFIVLFTDGDPTNTPEEIEDLDQTIQKLSDEKRFIFLPFCVGNISVNGEQTLAKLAAQMVDKDGVVINPGTAYKMSNFNKFTDVFKFVSASISGIMEKGGTQAAQLPTSVATAITFDLST
jgi:uncharacterized protein YegL